MDYNIIRLGVAQRSFQKKSVLFWQVLYTKDNNAPLNKLTAN